VLLIRLILGILNGFDPNSNKDKFRSVILVAHYQQVK